MEDITPEGSVAPVFVDDTPIAPVSEEPQPHYSDLRRTAYQAEADPLFFQWQRGEAQVTEQVWLDKIAEIRDRYPYE